MFDNDPICLISEFVHNLATQLASCGQQQECVGQPDCGRIPVLNRLVHHPVDKNEMPPHLWPECQYNLTYRELEKDKKYKLIYYI